MVIGKEQDQGEFLVACKSQEIFKFCDTMISFQKSGIWSEILENLRFSGRAVWSELFCALSLSATI